MIGNNPIERYIESNISIIDHYGETLEVGSFKYKSNAFAYQANLEKLTERPVSIIYKNLYYSVYISSFDNREMALQVASKISEEGYEPPNISKARQNTSSIMLGQFLTETEAMAFRDKMKGHITKKIWIIFENNRYKVVITKFKNHMAAVEFANQIEK